jgi:6-pyruvoyltetrahydropterin/6-carboxytetrahydropterin synthase
MKIRLERRYRFSASHRYYRQDWTPEQNRTHFGKCANAPGHGHNYRLVVTVVGRVDPVTGFVVDLMALDTLIRERILDAVDHQHINAAVAEFGPGGAIPSTENLVAWVHGRLVHEIPGEAELVAIRLEEDDDLASEWRRGD